jgi:hypothetical protein
MDLISNETITHVTFSIANRLCSWIRADTPTMAFVSVISFSPWLAQILRKPSVARYFDDQYLEIASKKNTLKWYG